MYQCNVIDISVVLTWHGIQSLGIIEFHKYIQGNITRFIIHRQFEYDMQGK